MLLLHPHKERTDLTVSSLIFSWESLMTNRYISPSKKQKDELTAL